MADAIRLMADLVDYYTDHYPKGQIMWIGAGFAFTIGFIPLKNCF